MEIIPRDSPALSWGGRIRWRRRRNIRAQRREREKEGYSDAEGGGGSAGGETEYTYTHRRGSRYCKRNISLKIRARALSLPRILHPFLQAAPSHTLAGPRVSAWAEPPTRISIPGPILRHTSRELPRCPASKIYHLWRRPLHTDYKFCKFFFFF